MKDFEALVALNLISDIGSIRLKRLLDYFDRPKDIMRAHHERLMAVAGIGQELAYRVCSFE